ncbi:hypothetical protein IE077_002260 [Cardiosporidium cionae]|uniref:Sulfatase-modifying factor enzyme-like domain-containing protein n=1 Tax=Cardiosporidium cionae TaxID=476202 RepID=A0ABQ7JBC5_9APIC|nr:hypothetical protein IE077_002260 [Cardiosporidium cionae]|eukprot:KAF8821250.1 hypothetical protein IE077_002260 [Cardiosporidium cionae]
MTDVAVRHFLEGKVDESRKLFFTKTVLLHSNDAVGKRQEIRNYFDLTWQLYEKLFDIISSPIGYYVKAEPLRHPLIFYMGHTAAFYINKLNLGRYLHRRVDPVIESACAVGVDEMSWDDLDCAHYEWPSESEALQDPNRATEFLERIRSFRNEVKKLVFHVIDTGTLELPIIKNSVFWVILMGIEHERIHLETSSMIIRRLPLKYISPNPLWKICEEGMFREDPPSSLPFENSLIGVASTTVNKGRRWDSTNDVYGWDNEFGSYSSKIDSFKASKYLVTNREYLEFYEAGGYNKQEFWTNEGWHWLSDTNVKHPIFWIGLPGNGWRLRLMTTEIPMAWDWPVEVNFLEAKAFCNWKAMQLQNSNIRLPTSDEWFALRDQIHTDQPYWDIAPGNINLEYWASSCPVNKFQQTPSGFYDVIGNVWQHTESLIDVLDGFTVHALYDDFTTPTINGCHNEMKGGCWISTGSEATRNSQIGFRRHFYQHSGFRYVESSNTFCTTVCPYESDPINCAELFVHYEISEATGRNYPVELVKECISAACKIAGITKSKALEIGCGAGRVSFELARHFSCVQGTDTTARLFRLAQNLKDCGRIRYLLPDEGELVSYRNVQSSDLQLGSELERVSFHQIDPSATLNPKFHSFELVCISGVLELAAWKVALENICKMVVSFPPESRKTLLVLTHSGIKEIHAPIGIGGVLFSKDENTRLENSLCTSDCNLENFFRKYNIKRAFPSKDLLRACRNTARRQEIRLVNVSFWIYDELDGTTEQNGCPDEISISMSPLVHSHSAEASTANSYENSAVLDMYLDFHYDKDCHFSVKNYPVACAQKCIEKFLMHGMKRNEGMKKRALELGGGIGRVSLELAREFDEVIFSDFSQSFVQATQRLLSGETLEYSVCITGSAGSKRNVNLEELGYAKIRDRVCAKKIDAMHLPSAAELYGKFDLIFAGNLIDRLPNPFVFLEDVGKLLNVGGLLVISSPYTWLSDWTARENWIGGFKRDAEDYRTITGLRNFLLVDSSFEGLKSYQEIGIPEDIKFVIRESSSCFQYSSAEFSVWKYLGER